MLIRKEQTTDVAAICQVTDAAFAEVAQSDGREGGIVDRLRAAGALTLSLVAEEDGVVGHVAFSPVSVGEVAGSWYGLGPVSVAPDRQGQGVGKALITAGLDQLRQIGAGGCVVLGDPAYYQRFGFRADPKLAFEGVPAAYFMQLTLAGPTPEGQVTYHPAFFDS